MIPDQLPGYVGEWCDLERVRLPLLRVRWYEDTPRLHVTQAGYRRGCRPGNFGRKFPPEPLTTAEVLRLLEVCPRTKAGVRNRALIAFLWRTGLRIGCEALKLRPHHVDMEARRVLVMSGKGSKRRTVAVDMFALMELGPWLWQRAMLGVPDTAPLFCTVSQPNPGQPLWDAYVRDVFHEYGKRAGIPKRIHPHGFRHSMACDLVRDGFPLGHAQAQLGHSSIATTAVYLRGLGVDEAFDAIAARPMPGGAR